MLLCWRSRIVVSLSPRTAPLPQLNAFPPVLSAGYGRAARSQRGIVYVCRSSGTLAGPRHVRTGIPGWGQRPLSQRDSCYVARQFPAAKVAPMERNAGSAPLVQPSAFRRGHRVTATTRHWHFVSGSPNPCQYRPYASSPACSKAKGAVPYVRFRTGSPQTCCLSNARGLLRWGIPQVLHCALCLGPMEHFSPSNWDSLTGCTPPWRSISGKRLPRHVGRLLPKRNAQDLTANLKL